MPGGVARDAVGIKPCALEQRAEDNAHVKRIATLLPERVRW